jgi:GNAT superfamily N-acetyltransferase
MVAAVPDLRLLPARDDETLQRCLDLVAAVFPERAVGLAETKGWLDAVDHHAHVLALRGDEPAGVGVYAAEPRMRERAGAYAMLVVAPDHRRTGVATALYAALSRTAEVEGTAVFDSFVKEGDEASLGWATRRGFRETGRESRLELDLEGVDAPAPDPPDGVAIVSWADRPDLTHGIYEVAVEAYPDIPGAGEDPMEPFEDWLAHDLGGPGDKPEATFLALYGDEVVGYAKFSLTEAQPTVAFHDVTGVKRAWRGRGIAGALKRTEIAWAKRHGYERLSTMNEERNAPIRRLNERHGYVPVPGRVFVRGPLAPAEGASDPQEGTS